MLSLVSAALIPSSPRQLSLILTETVSLSIPLLIFYPPREPDLLCAAPLVFEGQTMSTIIRG